jgi:drug/metabolite transporter (DMT)-like permease
MNVADASLLHRSSPFFVIIFSAIFLKNRLKRVQAVALLLACAGSVLVINPSFNSSLSAALVGVLSAAGAGGAYVIINYLKGKESNATIIFFFSAVSCLLSAIMGGSHFVVPHGVQWLLLAGIGVFAALGQIFLTQAYKMSEPGEVSIMNYLGIVFSAILGFCFLNEQVGARSLAGMACIFTAALLLYFVKNSKPIGRKSA